MDLTNVIKAPIVTEKSTGGQTQRKYSFRVHEDANKIEIASAVERMYGVKVDSVRIIPVQKKTRLVGRGREITKRPAAKKAVVTLQAKQTLDFNKIKVSK
jgi:large subunit ribosomal protein L23